VNRISTTQAQAVSEMAHPASNPFIQFLRKPMNWFLLFIPLTVVLEHLHGMPLPVGFFSAGLAIAPIAGLIVRVFCTFISVLFDSRGLECSPFLGRAIAKRPSCSGISFTATKFTLAAGPVIQPVISDSYLQ
jgi:hypothetical protein